ncbi:hypothetical protein [Hydrogenimonas thermophila]|uniref:Uncharacterized protein n=1 Tax=Hydrogenimonas thermophila TaxID=223786 RepID=A0A1I5R7J3_9BACT|nr:hypothetical protein [Hydrogenimonas thermophila]WOE70709.1 hypothetical protein RZR91_03845 [Hydrogenimonas thermophila]WOE73227.1 hypothetical protein RZR97_03830 [Hydrogenimonas thermophila]SFP54504.1 hypothetical protein SAMN05216234_12517 [Hydrogenimonas thermophila]
MIDELEKIEEIYCSNRIKIRSFLIDLLKKHEKDDYSLESLKKMVKETPFLMVAYVVNDDCIQESPNIYKDHINNEKKGLNRRSFLRYIRTKRDRFFMSDPYYNETSGKVYVLLYEEHENKMLFSNFDIKEVLKELNLWDE